MTRNLSPELGAFVYRTECEYASARTLNPLKLLLCVPQTIHDVGYASFAQRFH